MAKPSTKKQNSFTYKRRTKDQINRRATQSGGGYDSIFVEGFPKFVPQEGKNILRILPATYEDADHYGLDIYVHYGVGPDKNSYLCLGMLDKSCPICQERHVAEAGGDKDYANQLKAKKRVLVWVIDRKNEDEGPRLWSMAFTSDKDLAKLSIDEIDGTALFIEDPDTGYDIVVDRSGAGLQTRYVCSIARSSTPLHVDNAVAHRWFQFVVDNPLDSCLNFYPYDHISKVFSGVSGDTTDDIEDEDEDEEIAVSDSDHDSDDEKAELNSELEDEDEEEEDEEDGEDEITSRLAAMRKRRAG